MSIQASLSGDYHLPGDGVLVSGVYWVALHPPVKFTEKVSLSIQHCGSVADSALTFVTAMCTQESRPYKFKPLPGGSFSESDSGNIEINHFSAAAIFGQRKSKYSICTYYIPKALNIYEAHIAITPKLGAVILVRQILWGHVHVSEKPWTLYVGRSQ